MRMHTGEYDVGTSITAHNLRVGISGGTLSTMMTVLEDVPKEKLRDTGIGFVLSPGTFVVLV